jgi:hypothetical protein
MGGEGGERSMRTPDTRLARSSVLWWERPTPSTRDEESKGVTNVDEDSLGVDDVLEQAIVSGEWSGKGPQRRLEVSRRRVRMRYWSESEGRRRDREGPTPWGGKRHRGVAILVVYAMVSSCL